MKTKASKIVRKKRLRRKIMKDSETFVVTISFTRHIHGRRMILSLLKNYIVSALEQAKFRDVHLNVKSVDVSFAMPEDAIPEFQVFEPYEDEYVQFNEYDVYEIIN